MTTTPDTHADSGAASSAGTRSKAGSNYGDWSPDRATDQPDACAVPSSTIGYNPVGMAGKGPCAAPDDGVAQQTPAMVSPTASPLNAPAPPPVVHGFLRWWNRLKSLFRMQSLDRDAPVPVKFADDTDAASRSAASGDVR